MSGLSLPLPTTVERIAASLVPWADGVAMSANQALQTGVGGSIVADTDERSGDGRARLTGVGTTVGTGTEDGGRLVIPNPGVGVVPSRPGIPAVPGSPAPAAPGTGRAQPADSGDPTPTAPSTPSGSPAPAPGPTPTPTEPAQPPVQSDPDPVAAVKPVVDEVLAPLAPIVEDTTTTVVETVAPVVPVLPGIGK